MMIMMMIKGSGAESRRYRRRGVCLGRGLCPLRRKFLEVVRVK